MASSTDFRTASIIGHVLGVKQYCKIDWANLPLLVGNAIEHRHILVHGNKRVPEAWRECIISKKWFGFDFYPALSDVISFRCDI
jgi:hypothetical protein